MVQKEDILNYLKSHQKYYLSKFGVQFVGLFGSFAKDEVNKESDIDILYKIEKDKTLSLFKYLELQEHLEGFFQKKVDLVREEALKPRVKNSIQKNLHYV